MSTASPSTIILAVQGRVKEQVTLVAREALRYFIVIHARKHALKRGRSWDSCNFIIIDARAVLRMLFVHVLAVVAGTWPLHGVYPHVNNSFILLRPLHN